MPNKTSQKCLEWVRSGCGRPAGYHPLVPLRGVAARYTPAGKGDTRFGALPRLRHAGAHCTVGQDVGAKWVPSESECGCEVVLGILPCTSPRGRSRPPAPPPRSPARCSRCTATRSGPSRSSSAPSARACPRDPQPTAPGPPTPALAGALARAAAAGNGDAETWSLCGAVEAAAAARRPARRRRGASLSAALLRAQRNETSAVFHVVPPTGNGYLVHAQSHDSRLTHIP
jgi:hypothetical protein